MKRGGFDVIIGNPPYGAFFSKNDEKSLAENFESFGKGVRDVYACFLEQSFRLAGKGGTKGFIVPSAWLGGPDYEPASKKNYWNGRLETIIDLPFDIFTDAYVDTVIVLFAAEKASAKDKTKVKTKFAFPKKNQESETIQLGDNDYGSRLCKKIWRKIPGQKFIL